MAPIMQGTLGTRRAPAKCDAITDEAPHAHPAFL